MVLHKEIGKYHMFLYKRRSQFMAIIIKLDEYIMVLGTKDTKHFYQQGNCVIK